MTPNPKAAKEGENLLVRSLKTIESVWLKGDTKFFFRENAMTLRFFSLQRRRIVCYKITPPWRVKNNRQLTEKLVHIPVYR
jgi:hypothetical protein